MRPLTGCVVVTASFAFLVALTAAFVYRDRLPAAPFQPAPTGQTAAAAPNVLGRWGAAAWGDYYGSEGHEVHRDRQVWEFRSDGTGTSALMPGGLMPAVLEFTWTQDGDRVTVHTPPVPLPPGLTYQGPPISDWDTYRVSVDGDRLTMEGEGQVFRLRRVR